MSLNNLLKVGAVSLPKVEQAAAWLIEQGPVVEDPALPAWVLRTLVRQNRIARLRRGVYAVPDAKGQLRLSPYAVGAIVEPGSVVSFHAALAFWNVTDQTPRRIGVVSRTRHTPIRFGPQSIVFVPRPRELRRAEFKLAKLGDREVRIATPQQAFIDALTYPPLAGSPAEMLAILAHGLGLRIFTVASLRRHALARSSMVVARRLGLLIELATGEVDAALLQLAQSSHAYSSLLGPEDAKAANRVPRWLLLTPSTPERLRTAAGTSSARAS